MEDGNKMKTFDEIIDNLLILDPKTGFLIPFTSSSEFNDYVKIGDKIIIDRPQQFTGLEVLAAMQAFENKLRENNENN